jgi:hypothetical protein
MRSTLAYFVLLIFYSPLHAQDRSFTDYYFEAKKLVESLKTYQIVVYAHDSTYPFVSNEYLKNEVAKSFHFLNVKKKVDRDPDFLIKIIVGDIDAKVDYAYSGKVVSPPNPEYDVYEITMVYDVSFALSFETNTRATVYMPICTKKHYEKKYNYTLTSLGPSPGASVNSNWKLYAPSTPEEKKPVWEYAEDVEEILNTKFAFLPDFNNELIRFRKKK